MILEVCGESISIPNKISDWISESDDNRTEFNGMVESMIWAIKKKYNCNDNKKDEPTDSPMKDYLNALNELDKALHLNEDK